MYECAFKLFRVIVFSISAVDKEEVTVTLVKTDLQFQFSAAFSNVLQFTVNPRVDSIQLDTVSEVLQYFST